MNEEARTIIRALDLAPHPEGGWYKETWRAEPLDDGLRGAGTAIHFLLEEGQRSHWHRVDAAELWLWHAGAPLELLIEERDGEVETRTLGGDVTRGYAPQGLVPADRWQAAQARFGWSLVSFVVVPAFHFAGLELAPPGWSPSG